MTAPQIKVKIQRRPVLKLKVLPRFPASVTASSPILLDRTGNNYGFSFDGAAIADAVAAGVATLRIALTSNTIFYVSTAGSNSNNGLSAGLPFLTLQYAYDHIATYYDFKGFNVTIQLLDTGSTTTYTAGLRATIPTVGQNGPSGLLITGNASAKTRVVVSTTSADAIAASAGGTASQVMFSVTNLKVQTTSSGTGILAEGGGASIVWEGVDFGTCAGNHTVASHGAFLLASGNYTVSGNAVTHLAVGTNAVLAPHGVTITFSNSPAFSGAFAAADSGGRLFVTGMTFTNGNTVTGTKFTATGGAAVLPSLTDTVDYLPGNSPGVVGSAAGGLGGQYNRLQIPGEINLVSANYSVLPYDRTILVDATSGNITLTLFLVGGTQGGNTVQFHRIDNSGNTVTIAPFAGNAIEQANSGANFVLPITASVSFRSYNTNWYPVNNDTDWKGNPIPLAKGGTSADLSATGGAGKFLKQATTGAAVTVAAAVTSATKQIFTASGTYTPTPGCILAIIECVGGGGGGGGVANAAVNQLTFAGGGGGGGRSIKWVASPSAQTVTIGAAGTAGASGGGTGGTGGTTSVAGSYGTATGGAGGVNAASSTGGGNCPGGAAGVGSNGDVNEIGQPGFPAFGTTLAGIFVQPGCGGMSAGGHGGGGQVTGAAGAGSTGNNYGGGGSGASSYSAGGAAAGGAGAQGIVIITEILSA